MSTTKTEKVPLQEATLIFVVFMILGGILSYDIMITQWNQILANLGINLIYVYFPLLGSINRVLALTEQAKANIQIVNSGVILGLMFLLLIIIYLLYRNYKKKTTKMVIRAK